MNMRATPGFWPLLLGLLLAGCASGTDGTTAAPATPGPAPGYATAPDNSVQRVICQWHAEQTPDGRNIQVAMYYLVDEQGRIIRRLKDSEVE